MIGTLCRRMVEERGVCGPLEQHHSSYRRPHARCRAAPRLMSVIVSLSQSPSPPRQHDTVMGCCDGTKSLYYEPQQL